MLLDLARAQFALLGARRTMKRDPTGSIAVRDTDESPRAGGSPIRARAIARAVSRASRYGLFRPYCLVRAMALRSLLTAEGIAGASVRVGVRREGGRFEAHAWVRWGDEILGDSRENVARFTEVPDLSLTPPR